MSVLLLLCRVNAHQCITAAHSGQLTIPLLDLLVIDQRIGQAFCQFAVCLCLCICGNGSFLGFRLCIGDRHLLIRFCLGNGGFILDLLLICILLCNGLLLDGFVIGILEIHVVDDDLIHEHNVLTIFLHKGLCQLLLGQRLDLCAILGDVLEAVNTEQPDVLIVDSIQPLYNDALDAAAGSVSQVKDCTLSLMQVAKGQGITVFVIGHVNKEGSIAGPKVLEHMVDCVLYFEGDQHTAYRILRAAKNRFGATNEIGVFEMRDSGLVEVENPSEMLLSGRPEDAPGTCVTCVMEGARPVLAEIQALAVSSPAGNPRRTSNGFDYNRFAMLLAVLEKRGNLKVSQCDAYLNIIGGLTLEEPAADLSAVVAIASSYLDKPVPSHMAAIGEVGLSGEIRSINHMEQRLSEVQRLGFTQCIVPEHRVKEMKELPHLELLPVQNVAQALQLLVQGKLMK